MRLRSEYEEAMRLLDFGLSKREVGRTLGIPMETIASWRRYGYGCLKSGPNHSLETYEEAMRYVAFGMNDCQISRLMGIPHRTIRGWRVGDTRSSPRSLRSKHNDERCPICGKGELHEKAYAYLLGLYLGDGHIVEVKRGVFRLSTYLDLRYPGIIEECRQALIAVRTNGSSKVTYQERDGCAQVSAYWKHWPCLFPQHGPGLKHLRPIVLTKWQEALANQFPGGLLRGLIHSDGTRGMNTIITKTKKYKYPRYQFTNYSADIREIFCNACDAYGVSWTQMNWRTIAVSRRTDVAKLDQIIGPKR
jgi:hypothetical protein